MSVVFCSLCAWLIDSDDDPECFVDGDDKPKCEWCREEEADEDN